MKYREAIRAPWWTYGVVAGLLALLSFTFSAVITVPFGIVMFVVLAAIAVPLIWRRRLLVSVDEDRLRVGRHELSLSQIGEVTALDEAEVRMIAGPLADTRARLILRNLACRTGVKIELTAGETPYWLVSSRHPDELARALSHA
ncbi:MAG: DUF3093 domain-containing protein [Candidatus Nanopelagicales bacterium]